MSGKQLFFGPRIPRLIGSEQLEEEALRSRIVKDLVAGNSKRFLQLLEDGQADKDLCLVYAHQAARFLDVLHVLDQNQDFKDAFAENIASEIVGCQCLDSGILKLWPFEHRASNAYSFELLFYTQEIQVIFDVDQVVELCVSVMQHTKSDYTKRAQQANLTDFFRRLTDNPDYIQGVDWRKVSKGRWLDWKAIGLEIGRLRMFNPFFNINPFDFKIPDSAFDVSNVEPAKAIKQVNENINQSFVDFLVNQVENKTNQEIFASLSDVHQAKMKTWRTPKISIEAVRYAFHKMIHDFQLHGNIHDAQLAFSEYVFEARF